MQAGMGYPENTQGVAHAHRGGGELRGREGTNPHML
jgi:hypothetical protein